MAIYFIIIGIAIVTIIIVIIVIVIAFIVIIIVIVIFTIKIIVITTIMVIILRNILNQISHYYHFFKITVINLKIQISVMVIISNLIEVLTLILTPMFFQIIDPINLMRIAIIFC